MALLDQYCIMNWIVGIILLGIVIGIARAYPKTSILIAIVLFFIYINKNQEDPSEKKTYNTETRQNTRNSNAIYTSPINYKPSNLNSESNYNYRPSTTTSTRANSNISPIRIGAVCKDGTTSRATSRGACSHHDGVDYWLYE